MRPTAADLRLAAKAKKHGANYSLRIILEARRVDIPVSLGFALVEQESSFRNVYGSDPRPNGGTADLMGKPVTKLNYTAYRGRRGSRGQGGMQGVGPCQLTWWEFQDFADKLGGCWVPKHNIRVGFDVLASLIQQRGMRKGIARYNGDGPAADNYATGVLSKQAKWHERLT